MKEQERPGGSASSEPQPGRFVGEERNDNKDHCFESSAGGRGEDDGASSGSIDLSSKTTAVVIAVAVAAASFLIKAMKTYQHSIYQSLLRVAGAVQREGGGGFLDDDIDLMKRAQNDTLWRACDTITSAAAATSTRFWYYKGEPRNIFEELAVKIYKDTPYWDEAASFEYWCNIIELGKGTFGELLEHPWHTDRDEDILAREKKFVTPLMGSVFYGFIEKFEGGEFHMIDSVPYMLGTKERAPTDECHPTEGMCLSNPHLFDSDSPADHLRVPTRFNRLIYADVSHFHKVDRVRRGKRYALAVNANHWLPYDYTKLAPANEELVEMAKSITSSDFEVQHDITGILS
eukprot:CAMPEP_0181029760 /NCGR_PEP_ID=MMETSP1070-20121207/5370_1 /TAXON_ID=265543 /ORGANISM="Minutocellus polymorphus, Strain NH13" /LENGTH=345 /DNA_ID=CAMNT_0023107091 /DNA_START=145 /DNA_END=1184 /DNA_ORIENTATION=+